MEFAEALKLVINDDTSDRDLNEAWVAAGKHKLRLRQLCFDSVKPVPVRRLYPALNQANQLIDQICNQFIKRSIFDWYFRLSPQKRKQCHIEWVDSSNFPRNWNFPGVDLPGKSRI